jgi:sigma-B regulation protein RsbU (phosphoserine phosphatase)
VPEPASTEGSTEQALDAFYSALLDDDPAALYDKAPCGYLSTTPDGTIVKVNQTLLTLTGYERNELVGKKRFADLLTAGGKIYHETHYAPMLQMQGSAREIALDIVAVDGKRLPVLVNSVLERDEQGTPVVVRAAIFEATERREYERELLRAKDRAEASEKHATLLARTLQQTLIPPSPPEIPGLDIAAAYRPAGSGDEVGGDFYDIFQIGPGDWVVAIGDVCGKGVEAAVVTALARHTIRAAAVHQHRPSDILRTLNAVLLQQDSTRFCTVTLVRLRQQEEGWQARISSGGHPPPIYCCPETLPVPTGPTGTLLGVIPDADLHDHDVDLSEGQSILLYTDGVTEGRRGREFFGEARLIEVVAENAGSAAGLVHSALVAVLDFQSGHARDDVALVGISVPAG